MGYGLVDELQRPFSVSIEETQSVRGKFERISWRVVSFRCKWHFEGEEGGSYRSVGPHFHRILPTIYTLSNSFLLCFVSLLRLSDSFSAFFVRRPCFFPLHPLLDREILPQADGTGSMELCCCEKKRNDRGHVYKFTGYSRLYRVCILGITGFDSWKV